VIVLPTAACGTGGGGGTRIGEQAIAAAATPVKRHHVRLADRKA
jgi:hypothetical protein